MLLRKRFTKGFMLVELIVVISIIGILAAIAVPAYGAYVEKAKEEVCKGNCLQVERMYEMHLEIEGIEHSDTVFEQFLMEYGKDICPGHGVITYVEGKVKCSVHTVEDDNDGEVPFL